MMSLLHTNRLRMNEVIANIYGINVKRGWLRIEESKKGPLLVVLSSGNEYYVTHTHICTGGSRKM